MLLVGYEPPAAQVLAKGLREQAYAVDVAADGDRALFQVSTTDYDAIILDVMLPVKSGLTVCRAVRASGSAVPILMRSEEHTSELQSHLNLVCRLLLEKKKNHNWNAEY